jgi:hypothetical protein
MRRHGLSQEIIVGRIADVSVLFYLFFLNSPWQTEVLQAPELQGEFKKGVF